MTDALLKSAVTVARAEPSRLIRIEIWSEHTATQARLAKALGTDLPGVCRSGDGAACRLIWVEQDTWLARTTPEQGDALLATLTAALGEDGSAADMSGALVRLRITGPGWRELLTIGAVFDVENPAFAPGCMAGTLIAHSPVRLDVVSETVVEAYTPPSYAPDLTEFWHEAAERMAAR